MEKTENKKCTKAVPVFFFLAGAMSALAGAEEVGGFLIVVAFLVFCMCAMIDKVNEIPDATTSTGSNTQWFDDETITGSKHKFMEYSEPVVNVDGTPMVGGVDLHGNAYGVTSH